MKCALVTILFLISCTSRQLPAAEEDSVKPVFIHIDSANRYRENDRDTSWAPFILKYQFSNFSAQIYTGQLAAPDYKSVSYGKDSNFHGFLEEELKGKGVNFAGHFTIIESSCGAMCVALHIVDRISGKIYSFPVKGDGHWGYRYEPESRLLIGNATMLNESMTRFLNKWDIAPVFYIWKGTYFEKLQSLDNEK